MTGWNVLGGTHLRTVIDDRGEFVCEAHDGQIAHLIVRLADAVARVEALAEEFAGAPRGEFAPAHLIAEDIRAALRGESR